MKQNRPWKIETLAVHAGHSVDPSTGAVSMPIHMSTTFEREPTGEYRQGYIYSRSDNPTRHALEEGLAAMEGGDEAAAFASGTAATMAIFQALDRGDHVIAAAETYHGTAKLLRDIFLRWGVEASFVDMTNIAEVKAAVGERTKIVWVETPSNPQMKITDIAAVAQIAREAGALSICDNTLAPIVQRPLDLGADLVVHSTTKYLGGHSDVVGGVVITKNADEFFARIRDIQSTGGAVPSPFDCWLILRGLRTLPWRMRAHSANALQVAAFLAQHSRVEKVHYPGLESHCGHEIARRQMGPFSGMLSFEVHGGAEAAIAVCARTELFVRATSLGGVESLIEHRASIKGEDPRTPKGLLRLSVGLEHPDDLIADLGHALE